MTRLELTDYLRVSIECPTRTPELNAQLLPFPAQVEACNKSLSEPAHTSIDLLMYKGAVHKKNNFATIKQRMQKLKMM